MIKKYSLVLKQGIGKASIPIVKPGEQVERGQLLADVNRLELGVPLHSPIQGKILEVDSEKIIVEGSLVSEDFIPIEEGENYIETVRNAGIIGMGGAGFPTYVKMKTDLSKGGYVICNAVECEPILKHNIRQIELEAEKLIKGIQIVKKATGAEKAIIAMKMKNIQAIKTLTKLIKLEEGIRVLPMKDIYPSGEERAIIKSTLNILLKPDQLPFEANCVVLNAETLISVYDAIENKKPLIDKYVTVAGNFNDIDSKRFEVKRYPIGTYISDIIHEYGGVKENTGEILIGGPHTGHRATSEESITKISGGVIATDPFVKVQGKLGIIQCACGPNKERMYEIAKSMEANVVAWTVCKNANDIKGTYKCADPGNCPGQAEKVLELRRAGAEEILIGHCSDCSNTVMQAAPKIGLKVHHGTDHALRAMNLDVIRELKVK
ncbi:MAG: proline reductase-associated electron transfer protein PrdC [Peptoniphilaceae bacterium]